MAIAVEQYLTDELVARVKVYGAVPTSQITFTDEDILNLMSDELQSTLVPEIRNLREEYFTHTVDVAVGPNNNEVTIPVVAHGQTLRIVYWIATGTPNLLVPINRVTPETMTMYPYGLTYNVNTGVPTGGYYIQNNKLIFYPQLQTEGNIRLVFVKQPNALVRSIDGGKVTAAVSLTNTITLDSAPSTWDTGTELDIIEPSVPFNLADPDGITIVSKAGFDIELSAADFAKVAVGDYIALRGQSQFVQYIPPMAYPYLVQLTTIKCLEAMDDQKALQNAYVKAGAMMKNLKSTLNPRVEGAAKKIINTDSIFTASSGRWRWR